MGLQPVVGEFYEFKDGSARLEVLELKPDRYAKHRAWVKVVFSGKGKYEFLDEGREGFIDFDYDDGWKLIKAKLTKKEVALGIECSSFNRRRER